MKLIKFIFEHYLLHLTFLGFAIIWFFRALEDLLNTPWTFIAYISIVGGFTTLMILSIIKTWKAQQKPSNDL